MKKDKIASIEWELNGVSVKYQEGTNPELCFTKGGYKVTLQNDEISFLTEILKIIEKRQKKYIKKKSLFERLYKKMYSEGEA